MGSSYNPVGGGSVSLPWVTPEDYGAAGNGTTDDTEAFQAALDAIAALPNGGELLCPNRYKLTDTCVYSKANSPITIRGLGWNSEIIAEGDFGSILSFHPGLHEGGELSYDTSTPWQAITSVIVSDEDGELVNVAPTNNDVTLDAADANDNSDGFFSVTVGVNNAPTFTLTPSTNGKARTLDVIVVDVDSSPSPASISEDRPPERYTDGVIGLKISDLTIRSNDVMTSGFAIDTEWTDGAFIDHIQFGQGYPVDGDGNPLPWNIHEAIRMSNQSNCSIRRCTGYVRMGGVYVDGDPMDGPIVTFGAQGSIGGDCMFWGPGAYRVDPVATAGSYGIHIAGGTGGFMAEYNTNLTGFQNGVRVSSASGNANREVFVNLFGDRNGLYGCVIEDGSYTSLNIYRGWGSGNGKTGLRIGNSTGQPGAAGAISIIGGDYYINAQAEPGPCIYIDAGSSTMVTVMGVNADDIEIVSCDSATISGGAIASATLHGQDVTIRGVLGLTDTP